MKIERLRPAFKDYIWGGNKLREVYAKESELNPLAESWELSTHPAGESVIFGGDYGGLTLGEYISKNPGVLGKRAEKFDRFPVLIKFIDAKESLSVQVHPSDEYALKTEGELGKTEMWLVLASDPGAYIYFGVERETDREEFERAIKNNTVERLLHREPVKPGDVFFIEAGTLHAIGAGIMICEIQQNSNCTYRVYDYGRIGADGKPRQLHIDKALDVAKFTPSKISRENFDSPDRPLRKLGSCEYFTSCEMRVDGSGEISVTEDSFLSVISIEGGGWLKGQENEVKFTPGESLFVPAGSGKIEVSGDCSLVLTEI